MTDRKRGETYAVTPSKIAYLRRSGLVAAADEWWRHPSGTFSLAPVGYGTSGDTGTARVRIVKGEAVPTGTKPPCPECGKVNETGRRYCSHRCATRARAAAWPAEQST